MWMEKLSSGVLRVMTPLGPRYISPTFWQRLHLLWIFRNFDNLPEKVLSARQQQLVDVLCAETRRVSWLDNLLDAPIIGTVERQPAFRMDELPPRRATSRVSEVVPLADQQGS